MMDDEKREFLNSMGVLKNLFARESLDNATVEVYWQILKSYEIQDIKLAINRYVRNPDCGQFFPKPADIIREIEGSLKEIASLAWQKVVEGIREEEGKYSNIFVVYDDPVIHLVLNKMGGHARLAQCNTSDFIFLSHEFKKIYLSEFGKREKVNLKLFFSKFDSRRNIEVKFIGNKDEARMNLNNFANLSDDKILIEGKLEKVLRLGSDNGTLLEIKPNEAI